MRSFRVIVVRGGVCGRRRNGRWGRWRQEVEVGVEGVEERYGGGGRDDPFWSCVIEIVEHDVDADGLAVPAKLEEVLAG